jgi:hypothetical protein
MRQLFVWLTCDLYARIEDADHIVVRLASHVMWFVEPAMLK